MDNYLTDLPLFLAKNIQNLRNKLGLTQVQLAKKADIPRSTLTYIESGESNPSLNNLMRIALALEVSLEELLSKPLIKSQVIPAKEVPVVYKANKEVQVQKILPDPISGMEIDRMTFNPGARFRGTPHIDKTKEYLYCEKGLIKVYVKGNQYELKSGDVLSFPGDMPHAYENLDLKRKAVCFSVVVFAPTIV